jgi:DNA-binding NtrC family response regulator
MRRILVVEDDQDQQVFYRRALVALGYHGDFAGSLSEAENFCSQNAYDLLIADLHLPDGEAPDFIWAFQEKFPKVNVLVVTGSPAIYSQIPNSVKGRFETMFKPFEADYFLRMVERLAGK